MAAKAGSTADGDVEVFGQLTVCYEDGTTGLAEDAAFKTSVITSGIEKNYRTKKNLIMQTEISNTEIQ